MSFAHIELHQIPCKQCYAFPVGKPSETDKCLVMEWSSVYVTCNCSLNWEHLTIKQRRSYLFVLGGCFVPRWRTGGGEGMVQRCMVLLAVSNVSHPCPWARIAPKWDIHGHWGCGLAAHGAGSQRRGWQSLYLAPGQSFSWFHHCSSIVISPLNICKTNGLNIYVKPYLLDMLSSEACQDRSSWQSTGNHV